jgi:tetratricopeptide (TPR) repeat protein
MNHFRQVLRIFLSSTSADLNPFREKASEAIQLLGHVPVRMETFTALPGDPVSECRAKAAEADATVVLVGHRYGDVPPPERGGDGERSITWLEVEAAQQAGKPVFAFLVDPRAVWKGPKEQDRLDDELDNAEEVVANIRRIKEFRSHLQTHCTYTTFTGTDDLKAEVTAALANFVRNADSGTARSVRHWRPLVVHALQPARHFHGRDGLVDELIRWVKTPVPADRVISLVAVGGTGKTALVQKVIAKAEGHFPGGLFVWSFYHDVRTEEFLRLACGYFGGDVDVPPRARLERLLGALSDGEPHLLVLDGLERVQSDGHDGLPRGSLRDPQLSRLLQHIAGGCGRARAVITSRFPLEDLAEWTGARHPPERRADVAERPPANEGLGKVPEWFRKGRAIAVPETVGHRTEQLDDLDESAARAVLREWGVKGDDRALDALAEPLHRHALSVAVLASFLANYHAGDPSKAPEFHRDEVLGEDPRVAKLVRILDEYARVLEPVEFDLLARLATFPREVRIAWLVNLVEAGGEVAGKLAGLSEARLRGLLNRLRELGLIFAYRSGDDLTYAAHPILRDYFKAAANLVSEDVHEAVRSRLALSLSARPEHKPTRSAELDFYEMLIEHTRLAGRIQEAFEYYESGLGGYAHLGEALGENDRGLRILKGFSSNATVEGAISGLPSESLTRFALAWALHARSLGALDDARTTFRFVVQEARRRGETRRLAEALYGLAELEMVAGRLFAAYTALKDAIVVPSSEGETARWVRLHAGLAATLAGIGDQENARVHFRMATQLGGQQLLDVAGVQEAEFRFHCGDRPGAREQTSANLGVARHLGWHRTAALCELLLGRLLLPGDPDGARLHLTAVRELAARTGDLELGVRTHLLASDVERESGWLEAAAKEARAGLFIADDLGFEALAIELRIALARFYLASRQPGPAVRVVQEAFERIPALDSIPVWNCADLFELASRAHAQLGSAETAAGYTASALIVRQFLDRSRLPRMWPSR